MRKYNPGAFNIQISDFNIVGNIEEEFYRYIFVLIKTAA
jgi:hypothetical protein